MKLASFLRNGIAGAGLISGEYIYELSSLHPDLPDSTGGILADWNGYYPLLEIISNEIEESKTIKTTRLTLKEVQLMAPVPNPPSLRDGYAFRQHVETARRNRGLEMTPVFDSFPVFYFGNHHTIKGPGMISCMPDHFKKLDFELEAAIVISERGKNIRAEDADSFIAGLMIMNDFSARNLQMDEMLLNLGPAKGKDFITTTGPWLVTRDELKRYEVQSKTGHTGISWNLRMNAFVNGKMVSEGNLSDMEWTFAELIERASYGVELFPGDVIGSGTVGTGCFLELNGTGKRDHPDYQEQWLTAGDIVDLEIESLGILSNQIMADPSGHSILRLKK